MPCKCACIRVLRSVQGTFSGFMFFSSLNSSTSAPRRRISAADQSMGELLSPVEVAETRRGGL